MRAKSSSKTSGKVGKKIGSKKGRPRLLVAERKQRITIGMQADLFTRVRNKAKKEGRSIGGLCSYLIELGLNMHNRLDDLSNGKL